MMKIFGSYLSVLILILFYTELKSQGAAIEKYNSEQFVYWFPIEARIKSHDLTKRPIYDVRIVESSPRHGSVLDYQQDLWKRVKHGRQLLVGPFLDYYDVIRAMSMYTLARDTDESMAEEIRNFKDTTDNGNYCWYFLKFKIKERTRAFELIRMPASVASGDLKEFKQILWEGLGFQNLAIGPFPNQPEAEESKRLNRLEED